MFDTKVGVGLWQWLKCFALTGAQARPERPRRGEVLGEGDSKLDPHQLEGLRERYKFPGGVRAESRKKLVFALDKLQPVNAVSECKPP